MIVRLSNKYVNKLCKDLTSDYYLGTFACDKLPTKSIISRMKRETIFALIINLSPSHHTGTHFVCISYRQNKLVLFDSLGLPYEDPNIKKLVKTLKKHKDFTFRKLRVPIQSPESLACGFFCIAYVLNQSKNEESPYKFTSNFFKESSMLKFNDRKCIFYIKKFINF